MAAQGAPLPKAEFIEDVAGFVKGKDVDRLLQQLNDNLRVFRMKESELLQRRIRLHNKLPELQRTLDIINELLSRRAKGEVMTTDFELATDVFAKARITQMDTVNLWLGAGVMLEYPLEDAKALLEQNHGNCKKNLDTNEEDHAFIKDQITITEVSIARIYNYDVERRRKEGASSSS